MFNNSPTSQILFLWDIDGTLLKTNRRGLLSPHKNVLIKMGIKFNETIAELSGATDYEVFDSLLNGVEPLPSSLINECFKNFKSTAMLTSIGDKVERLQEENECTPNNGCKIIFYVTLSDND
jgi:phosphoglycolate phosphatase-like HAD superfamily hydrolase